MAIDFGRMARIIENEALNGLSAYSLGEMMDDLKDGIWSELNKGNSIGVYRRNLQRSYISRLVFLTIWKVFLFWVSPRPSCP